MRSARTLLVTLVLGASLVGLAPGAVASEPEVTVTPPTTTNPTDQYGNVALVGPSVHIEASARSGADNGKIDRIVFMIKSGPGVPIPYVIDNPQADDGGFYHAAIDHTWYLAGEYPVSVTAYDFENGLSDTASAAFQIGCRFTPAKFVLRNTKWADGDESNGEVNCNLWRPVGNKID